MDTLEITACCDVPGSSLVYTGTMTKEHQWWTRAGPINLTRHAVIQTCASSQWITDIPLAYTFKQSDVVLSLISERSFNRKCITFWKLRRLFIGPFNEEKPERIMCLILLTFALFAPTPPGGLICSLSSDPGGPSLCGKSRLPPAHPAQRPSEHPRHHERPGFGCCSGVSGWVADGWTWAAGLGTVPI